VNDFAVKTKNSNKNEQLQIEVKSFALRKQLAKRLALDSESSVCFVSSKKPVIHLLSRSGGERTIIRRVLIITITGQVHSQLQVRIIILEVKKLIQRTVNQQQRQKIIAQLNLKPLYAINPYFEF